MKIVAFKAKLKEVKDEIARLEATPNAALKALDYEQSEALTHDLTTSRNMLRAVHRYLNWQQEEAAENENEKG